MCLYSVHLNRDLKDFWHGFIKNSFRNSHQRQTVLVNRSYINLDNEASVLVKEHILLILWEEHESLELASIQKSVNRTAKAMIGILHAVLLYY